MVNSSALTNERSYDDDADDTGYTGGSSSASYDVDENEEGGWAVNKDQSDSLWDSAEDSSDNDDETPDVVEATDEEDDTELFEESAPRRRGRKPDSQSLLAGGAPPAQTPPAPKIQAKVVAAPTKPAAKTVPMAVPKAAAKPVAKSAAKPWSVKTRCGRTSFTNLTRSGKSA